MATATISKKAGESLVLGFRYHSPAIDDGETIIGVSVTAQTAGITKGTPQIDGNEVYCLVSGGSAGTDYTLRYTVSTDQGQILIDDWVVKVTA